MDARQFLAEFAHIANAPGGITKLRELVLSLAVSGRLVPQNNKEQSAISWLSEVDNQKIKLAREGKIHRPSKVAEITSDDIPFAPPSGWEFARLGRITTKIGSGSTPRGGSQVYVTKGIPFLRSQNVWNDGIRLDDVAYITHDMNENMGGTSVKTNDLLLNITGASLGRCALVPANFGPANVSQHVCIIRLVDVSARQYLHLCLQSPLLQKMIWGRQVGMAREGLSKKVLEQFEIPIPPIEEQSRIVAKVDELMALCDKLEEQQQSRRKLQNALRQATLQALANAQSPHELQAGWARLEANFGRLFREPEDVSELRSLCVELAIRGELTPRSERDVAESAHDLLKRLAGQKAGKRVAKLSQADAPFELPISWAWALFDDLLQKSESGWSPKCDAEPRRNGEWGVLKVSAVTWGAFRPDENKRLPPSLEPRPECEVKPGDFLLSRANTAELVARSVVVADNVPDQLLMSDKIVRLVFIDPDLKKWANLVNNSRFAREYYRANATGTSDSMRNVSRQVIHELPMPLPPKSVQATVLNKLTQLDELCSSLEGKLRDATSHAERLAISTVAAMTGIAIQIEEDEPVKVPQTELIAKLRLGQAPGVQAQAPLATILARHDGELSAQELWQRFGGEIDAFYAQLKTEVAHGWIEEPAVAEMREKIEKAEA